MASLNQKDGLHDVRRAPSPNSNHNSKWVAFYKRFSKWILIGYLLAAPAYLFMSAKVLTPGDMSAYLLDVGHWLPQDTALIADMEKFSKVAGKERGNVIRVSWSGCTESDDRRQSLVEGLAEANWPQEFADFGLAGSVFVDVLTIEQLYTKLDKAAPGLSKQQIYDQLKNVMVGDEGTTCIIATLTTTLPNPRAYAIKRIYEVADTVDQLDASNIRMFGGPVYTRQIDKSGANIATTFTPISIAISLLCAWFCLRRWPALVALFLNALIGTCVALVSMYSLGAVMDPVLMLLPGFWMIMLLSGGIHFLNYYFEIQNSGDQTNESIAAWTAKTAFRPAFIATLTTCIGLSSLCISDVMPVYRFGLHASIGLACSFVSQFLFLPAFLQIFGVPKTTPKPENRFWLWYEQFAVRFRFKTALVFLLLIAVGGYGFSFLTFSNRLKNQFAAGTTINRDTEWFEQEIGPLIPFEILVRFPKSNLPRPSQCLGFIDRLQHELNSLPYPVKTLSATAVVPFDSSSGARQTMRRAILDKRLQKHRQALLQTGYVLDESESELWRITVFTYSAGENSMQQYFSSIEAAVAKHQQNTENTVSANISYAGLGARMAVITQKLGGGLFNSSLMSAVLISLVVIVSLRSIALGLTAMLPNLFPMLISFGAFGYFQPSLDIGAIMTASIAMGIAVDDTIHFMYWFREGINLNLSRVKAIQLAINKCGRAIAGTSMICGLGFCVYFFCDFMPIARFGQLLFLMLGAALIGDLFFLPALLRSIPEKWIISQLGSKISTTPNELPKQPTPPE